MKYLIGRVGSSTLLAIAAVTLMGCLDLAGDPVADPTENPNPNPQPTNNAPTISGNPPPAVNVGSSYMFTPNASDPDPGDVLMFSIQNRPSWATFDSSTGSLSGLAPLGSEGTYSDIRISVSDGSLSTSLPVFSIDVTQVALGSATLSWTAPMTNTDGSPLVDLAGYRLYYGTSQGIYTNTVSVNNPGVTSFVVENLVPNTYYFVATAVNQQGIESNFSNMATKIVN